MALVDYQDDVDDTDQQPDQQPDDSYDPSQAPQQYAALDQSDAQTDATSAPPPAQQQPNDWQPWVDPNEASPVPTAAALTGQPAQPQQQSTDWRDSPVPMPALQPVQPGKPPTDWQLYDPDMPVPMQTGPTDWQPYQDPTQPQAEGTFGTIARKMAHNVLPTAAAIGAGTLALPAGPLAAIGAGFGAFMGTSALQESALKALGADDSAQMAINAKTNPGADIAGDVLSAATPWGIGGDIALARRGLGAGIGTAVEGFNQIQQGQFDPTRLGIAAATGAVFNKPRAGTAAVESAIGSAAGRITGRPDLYSPPPLTAGQSTPGPQSTGGVAQEAVPPSTTTMPSVGEYTAVRSSRSYPTETQAGTAAAPGAGDAAGVYVGDLDPTLAAALDAARPSGAPQYAQSDRTPGPPSADNAYDNPPLRPADGNAATLAPSQPPPKLRVRPGVDDSGQRVWNVLSGDGVLSQHPNAELALKSANTAARQAAARFQGNPDDTLRGPTPAAPTPTAEPPLPQGTMRLYQGERQPPQQFTTNRSVAEQYGPARYIDVANADASQFQFQPERMGQAPEYTTANPTFRQRTQPLEAAVASPRRPQAAAATAADPYQQAASRTGQRQILAATQESTPDIDAAVRRSLAAQRQAIVRGRGGRPIETAALPIGSEQRILEAGARATGLRGEPRQPYRLAAARQGAPAAQVQTHDGTVFSGATEADAAAQARAAGYWPHQIFNMNGALYTGPRAAPAATTPVSTAGAPPGRPPGGPPGRPPGGPPGRPPSPPNQPLPPAAAPTPRAASAKDLEDGIWPTIERFFMPGSRSESGKAGLAAFREGQGTTEQVKQQAYARFTNEMYRADNAVAKMSPLEQRKLNNYAEGGRYLTRPGSVIFDPTYQPPAELRPVLAAVRQGYQDFKTQLQALPQHDQMNFIQDYLPHMYENPALAQRFINDWYASPRGSLQKRSYPTQEDAIAAGLVPKALSPIDRFVRYSESLGDHISNMKTLNKLNDDGWLLWSRPRTVSASGSPSPQVKGAPPDGFMALKMPWANRADGAQAYAPRDMAETLNNLYDAGLRRNQTAANVYDFALQTKNMWTAAELGLSPYHAFTIVGETLSSNVSRAISELASGRVKEAGATLAKTLTSPFFDYGYGRRMIDVYLGKAQNVTPQENTIVDALKKANIKPVGLLHVQDAELVSRLGSYATSYMRGSLQNEFEAAAKEIFGGNYKKGAMFVPQQVARLMQTAMQPLFEYYIPAMKMAMASKDMASFLHANPRATADDLAAVGRRTADSMDNRFGEMVKDNLSMNKAFKDAAFVAMRSFAFTIGGPVREIMGGARSGVVGLLKGENRLSMTSKAYDPRVAYSIAFPLVTMAMASIVQFAMTGKWPDDWRDVVVPRTGGTVVSGKQAFPERMLLPGYHKDFLGYAYHPTRELWDKLAGPWQALYEQIAGKNYRDQPILPPKTTWPEDFKYRGQALLDKMTPIALQAFQEKNTPKLGSKIPRAMQVMGFREPGTYISNPNYQQTQTYFDQKAWLAKEQQVNRDRQLRGLQPIPARPLPAPAPQ